MSAIFGVVRRAGHDPTAAELGRMAASVADRAPDGCRNSLRGLAGLGHGLLRVNEEDWFDAQPIEEGPLTLVADTRLDNRAALAEALGIGTALLAEIPDSALLMAGWQRWGEACVERLVGDFVFAIWDAREGSLTLARDHMGQRAVYYHACAEQFVFASDLRSLWMIEGVPRTLSQIGIAHFLMGSIDPGPGTLFEQIMPLPPATLLRVDGNGEVTTRVYWQPHAAPEHVGRDHAHYLRAYREVLEEAVACRVRRLIRAPGLMFSGGYDSGVIAALGAPIVAARGRRIVAVCSVCSEGVAGEDSRAAAEAFVPRRGLDLRFCTRDGDTAFDDLNASFEATHSANGRDYVHEKAFAIIAGAGARLVMEGMGGDHTLHPRPGALLGRILRRGEVRRFVRELWAAHATGRRWRTLLRYDVLPALFPLRWHGWVWAWRRRWMPLWRDRPTNDVFAREMIDAGVIDPNRLRGLAPLHGRWRDEQRRALANASCSYPASIARRHALDFTRPFYDKRVVELALALPESLDFRDGRQRYLPRATLAELLPQRLLDSGPGNIPVDPEATEMVRTAGPAALAEVRAADRGGRLARFIDFAKVDALLHSKGARGGRDAYLASRAIILARFIDWVERSNH